MTLRDKIITAIKEYHMVQDVKPTKIYISHNNLEKLFGYKGKSAVINLVHGPYKLEVEKAYTHDEHFFLDHNDNFETSIEINLEQQPHEWTQVLRDEE